MNTSQKDQENYWFKGKSFGYGWTPTTWQGWLTIVLGVSPALIGALLMEASETTSALTLFSYLTATVVGVTFMLIVSIKKGPKPEWRWGSTPTKNKKVIKTKTK